MLLLFARGNWCLIPSCDQHRSQPLASAWDGMHEFLTGWSPCFPKEVWWVCQVQIIRWIFFNQMKGWLNYRLMNDKFIFKSYLLRPDNRDLHLLRNRINRFFSVCEQPNRVKSKSTQSTTKTKTSNKKAQHRKWKANHSATSPLSSPSLWPPELQPRPRCAAQRTPNTTWKSARPLSIVRVTNGEAGVRDLSRLPVFRRRLARSAGLILVGLRQVVVLRAPRLFLGSMMAPVVGLRFVVWKKLTNADLWIGKGNEWRSWIWIRWPGFVGYWSGRILCVGCVSQHTASYT